jgi:hypothetical protein
LNAHDERSVPFEMDALPPKEKAWLRLLTFLGRSKRNRIDERQAKAAEAGRKAREESK